MATFILVDSFNMYHRAKHVAMRGSNVDMRIGMAFHIMMNSVKMCYNKFNACLLYTSPSPRDRG